MEPKKPVIERCAPGGQLLTAAFVLLILAVPLVMIPSGLYRFELPKILLMSLAVAAALIVPSSGALSLLARWLLCGVLAAILAAALFSGNPLLGIVGRWPRYDGLLLSVVYAGLVVGGARVFRGAGGPAARLLWARGTSGVMIALAPLALAEALGARPLGGAVDVRPGATLGNATDLGIVALMGCVSLLPLAVRPKNWLMKFGAAAGALSSICSGSRAVIIALIIALLVLAAVTLHASIRSRRLGATATAVLGFLGVCVVLIFAVPATANRLFSAQTVSGRWLLWQQSMKLITDHLVLGVGPGRFVDLFPLYQSDAFARQVGTEFPADSPHMLPLELLAAGGLPLLLTFSAVAGCVLNYGVKTVKGQGAGPTRDFLTGSLAACVAAGMVYMTHFPSAGTLAAICVMAGSLLAKTSPETQGVAHVSRVWWRPAGTAAACVAALVASAFVAFGAAAELPLKSGYEAAGRGETAAADRAFQQAVALRPWDSDVPRLAAQAFAERTVTGDRAAGEAAVSWANRAIGKTPESVEAASALAIGMIGSGGAGAAVPALDKQISRAPWTSELYLLRGLAKANLGLLPEAIVDVERSRLLTPQPKRALTLLTGLYAARGMPDKAAALQQEIRQLDG